jgi:hypothetical protein
MNIEALSTPKGADTALAFVKHNPEILVAVDESTTIKNRQAKRTKNIVKVGRAAKYTRILTGSPITKSPMDLFSQCDFLVEQCLGFYLVLRLPEPIRRPATADHGPQVVPRDRRLPALDELNQKLEKIQHPHSERRLSRSAGQNLRSPRCAADRRTGQSIQTNERAGAGTTRKRRTLHHTIRP